jgi:hypothetical protein
MIMREKNRIRESAIPNAKEKKGAPTFFLAGIVTIAISISGCQANSNAGSSGNFGPGGTTSPGSAPNYNGTGNYDPANPPKNGFGTHCHGELEPAQRGNLILLAAYQGDGPSPAIVGGLEGVERYAWGSGGGGGGGGGGNTGENPC